MDNEKFLTILKRLYILREGKSIKSDFGKTLLIGGSKIYPHAVTIASQFADLSGVSFVSLAVPDEIYPVVGTRCSLTNIFEDLKNKDGYFLLDENKETLDHIFHTYSSILIGNGMKNCVENYRFLSYVIEHYSHNLIIDATGIRLLADYGVDVFEKKENNAKILLTPHLGEARRLLQSDIFSRDPIDYTPLAVSFCKRYGINILLKSISSILVSQKGKTFSSSYSPTPALAKAGSGDGLSGYLSGILAYGEKDISYDDLILFGDQLIHQAAARAEKKYSSGYSNILSCKEEIKEMIQEIIW